MRFVGLASLLLAIALAPPCQADDTLTLDLPSTHPPSTSAAPSASTPRSNGPSAFERYNAAHHGRSARMLTSRHQTPSTSPQRVVGRLGVAVSAATIRSAPGHYGRLLARLQPGTYLALTGEGGSSYGVLMVDRSTGWIPKSAVQLLNYEVMGQGGSGGSPPNPSAPPLSPLLASGQRAILQMAYTFLGVPYKWGGTKASGIDCSAFVQKCFASVGIGLPRTAHEQFAYGMPVSPDQLTAADRLYFGSRDGRITHTGIYIGNGWFIHSSSKHGGVSISRLTEALYRRMYMGARR